MDAHQLGMAADEDLARLRAFMEAEARRTFGLEAQEDGTITRLSCIAPLDECPDEYRPRPRRRPAPDPRTLDTPPDSYWGDE